MMKLKEILLLFCLLVTISTETSCPCEEGKYFVINSVSLFSPKYIFCTANKGPGQYLLINANCINNSFAQVSWQTDPSSKIRIEFVSIQYDCHNTSSNKKVS